jgi:fructosamine-3-kinase
MWVTLVNHLSETIHREFSLQEKTQLTSTNDTLLYKITDPHQSFFVKVCPKGNNDKFEQEQFGLNTLTSESLFYVADSIAVGESAGYSYHIIEWLDYSEAIDKNWFSFGETLARMHKKHEQKMFGFESDNFIGETHQPNRWHKHWDTFFSEQRIGFQLQLLAEKGIHLVNIDEFVSMVKTSLHHHHCKPSLLHGDLWQGNVGFCQSKPCVFDPACYYGDREIDIAMTELFAHFHQDFYDGYQSIYPLHENYHQRKRIYNLYHLLNHSNIYGNQYIDDARRSIAQILQ